MSSSNSPKSKLVNTLGRHYLISFSILLALLFGILYGAISVYLGNELDEDLLEDYAEFEDVYQAHSQSGLLAYAAREISGEDFHTEFVRIFAANGLKIYSSDLAHWRELPPNIVVSKITPSQAPTLTTLQVKGQEEPVRVLTGYLSNSLIIEIGESMEQESEILALLAFSFALTFLLSLPAIWLTGYLAGHNISRQLSRIASTARSIGDGDFSKRIATNVHEKELYDVAISVNQMAEKVQSLIREMREMTDNIAHDLRSPLGRIRAIAEMNLTSPGSDLRNALQSTVEECDRLLSLINATLDVAEAEAGIIRSQTVTFNLSEVIEDVCDLFTANAEQQKLTICQDVTKNIYLHGNRGSIQRMFANLIDNAIKYTPAGGVINVSLLKSDSAIRLCVKDTGIGIASSDQNRVFERFYRCDESRGNAGSGLGLSYSRAVARAHGGDIFVDSAPNKFTLFTISIPNDIN